MKTDFSTYPTEDLLRMGREGDSIYEAQQCLFKRWRQGVDLQFLVDLLESEITRERSLGAYFLGEADPHGLTDTVIKLAGDPLPECRRAFVGYMVQSNCYDEAIALGLAECLQDLELYVRVAVIRWAVFTSDERFDDFSRLVESGAGGREFRFTRPAANDFWRESERKRALRPLSIARRLRAEETVEDIRKDTPEEDNFVFDALQFSKHTFERHVQRRKDQRMSASSDGPDGTLSAGSSRVDDM